MKANPNDLHEFQNLIDELQAPETRPYAPNMPAESQQTLRRQLLSQYPQTRRQQTVWRLWQFAGTAVAILFLLFAAATFATTISNPAVQTGPGLDTVTLPTRTPQVQQPDEMIVASNAPANVQFGAEVSLADYQITEDEAALIITSTFQTIAPPAIQYTVFVHLLDAEGNLAAQQDAPFFPAELSARMVGQTAVVETQFTYDELPNGRYDIYIGLYNPNTGERYPVTADNSRIIADNQTAVWLTDWTVNRLTPCATLNNSIPTETDAPPCAQIGTDDQILSVVQPERPSADAPLTLEITVDYQVTNNEPLFLKLHYANPNWQNMTSGRMPLDGLSDWIPLDPAQNRITHTFTGNPGEMAQIVGTSQPALVIQIGYFVSGANGRELKLLTMDTYANAFDLTDPADRTFEVIP